MRGHKREFQLGHVAELNMCHIYFNTLLFAYVRVYEYIYKTRTVSAATLSEYASVRESLPPTSAAHKEDSRSKHSKKSLKGN